MNEVLLAQQKRRSLPQDELLTHTKKSIKSEAKVNSKKLLKFNNQDIEKQNQTDCPDPKDRRRNKVDIPEYKQISSANIIRSTQTVEFDLVELDEIHLDIPAFKLFKNNMTDFTEDGVHQFEEIIKKIEHFLGQNQSGKDVTLKIVGSASQIPTSFDPSLPNNNLNPDGSSIPGKTSVANNVKLAKARADFLAKKIQAVYPQIKIVTPQLNEIEIGSTPWTREVQMLLNQAAMRADKDEIRRIYEPFQKDQWVKVESKERSVKTIQPEAIKSYRMSTVPQLIYEGNVVKGLFIISKDTYDKLGKNMSFKTKNERDKMLKDLGLNIFVEHTDDKKDYWFLVTKEEQKILEQPESQDKIIALFKRGIIVENDIPFIEEYIERELKASSIRNP